MFIVAMAMIAAGYAFVYYGVGLWEYYRTSNKTPTAFPLSFLLGFSGAVDANGNPVGVAKLPFDETGGSAVTSGSNPVTPNTGGGVQTV